MASRIQIIFLSAIPIGASIFYLLWSFSRKRRSCDQADKKNTSDSNLPAIKITSDAGSPAEVEDHTQVVCSLRNPSGSDAGNFSLSDDTDVSSSSSAQSHIGECVDPEDCSSDLQETLVHTEPVQIDANSGMSNDEVPLIVAESVKDIQAISEDTLIVAETVKDIQTISEDTCIPHENDAVIAHSVQEADSSCLVDELVAETVIYKTLDAIPSMTNGTIDSDDKLSWASRVSQNDVDGEKVELMKNGEVDVAVVCKETANSMPDENSHDSSRDRNGNDCKRNNKRNKSNCQKQDKSVTTHAFDFPTEFCGQLIGRRGHNIAMIKEKSGVEIYIRAKMYNSAWQVVTLEGTQQQVNKALDQIRRKFPLKFYPSIDLNQCIPDVPVVSAELMQLTLPTGVSLEVVVCNVVTPNHVFVQQPTHPTFPSLERQTINMRACYGVEDVPCLPRPIDLGVICAAPVGTNWYRAQIVQSYPELDEYDLKLVDHGGYMHFSGTSLRQIRSDFMMVPFQAIECYLANVVPLKDDEEFLPEATTALEEMVKRSLLQCMVTAIESDGVPYVELTKNIDKGQQAVVINRELVHMKLARWLEM